MGHASHAVKNTANIGAAQSKLSNSLSKTTSQLKKNAQNNIDLGAKSCPLVNEASNVINGISKGDRATAVVNAGLLGLYGVSGEGGSSKIAQKSAVSTMVMTSATNQVMNKSNVSSQENVVNPNP